MDEMLREFLVESNEGLDQLDRDLIALERDPADRDLLARIFRCIHSIKGLCGFLGLAKLESVSHVGESLLARLRNGALRMNPDRADALLRLVDAIRELLVRIETAGDEGDGDYSDLISTLTALQQDGGGAGPEKNMGDILIEKGLVAPEQVAAAAQAQAHGDPRRIREILVETAQVPPQAIVEALGNQHDGLNRAVAPGSVADGTVRVDVSLLDRLMYLVDELVVARNQILEHPIVARDSRLAGACHRLNLITSALQDGVMKTGLQPIGTVWARFPRVVRDLAALCQKQLRLEMEGQNTALNRTMMEAIKDPFIHIVRNSVDHGIESPAVRAARGKPVEGRLLMRAFHRDGQVQSRDH